MAYRSYYQNSTPTWGTQQYQVRTPPRPTYQPQPSWGGTDYYQAHAGTADNSVFDYAWSKVRNFVRGGGGVGKAEAQYWHRKVYGGLGDVTQMLPADIGAAAAYEVWRAWKHHYGTYGQPLGHDQERQREALTGLAVGEVERLWQYTGRTSDRYGRLEASEIAASTASRIFTESWSLDDNESTDRPQLGRPRTNSMSMQSLSPSFDYGSNYSPSAVAGYDGAVAPSPYGLHRSRSFNAQMPGSYAMSSPVPIPSHRNSGSYPYGSSPGYVQSATTPNYMMAQQQQQQQPMQYGSYYGSYPASANSATPNTIIVHTPSSHHHRSRSHSRSHSHSHSQSHGHSSHHQHHSSSSKSGHKRQGSHSRSYIAPTAAYGY